MKIKTITSIFMAFMAFSLSAQIDGTIDSTFGINGLAVLSDQVDDVEARIVHVGTDGKYYLATNIGSGVGRDILLSRFLANGTIDNTYGTNGKVQFDPLLGSDNVLDMKLDANNKMIIVGRSYANSGQYFIARFLANGMQDTTFNHTGFVTGGGIYDDGWYGCTLEPNGDITAVGLLSDGDGANKAIARYKSNGTLDSAFGYNGINVLDESASETFSMIFRKSNTIYYIIGNTNGVDKLYAYDGTGNLISSFGASGKFTFNQLTGYRVYVLDMAIEGNDVYVSGYTRNMQTNKTDLLVGKMNQNGVLNNSFGFNGYYRADLASGYNDLAAEIKILADGSIFLAGETENANSSYTSATFLLASDGSLYSSYGTNGVRHYSIANSEHSYTMHMAEDAQGRLTMLIWNVAIGGKLEAVLMRLKTTTSGIGLEETQPIISNLSTYPNPTTASLFVKLNNPVNATLKFSIVDLSGRQIASETLDVLAGENTFDLSYMIENTHPGMYLLHVSSGGTAVRTVKIIRR